MLFAACGGGDDAGSSSSESSGGGEPVTLRLGYFPNVTHAPAIVGVDEGMFAEALGDNVTLETRDLQRRHRGHRGAVLRAHRRHVHRPEPGHQRLRPVRRRGAAHRRRAPRPAAPPWSSETGHHDVRADLEGTTLATPSLGNTQDVALRAWLADAGLRDRHRPAAATSRSVPQANADTLDDLPARRHRRRLGPRALGHPPRDRGRRPGARRRGRPVARRASSSPPTSSSAPSSSSEHPDVVRDLLAGLVDGDRVHRRRPRRGPGRHQRRHRGDHRPSRSPPR